MSSVAPRDPGEQHATDSAFAAHGEFCDLAGERYYAIYNVDKIAPFFVNVVSAGDHWLFVSSTGGLTAGRVSPETALFPYETVDKLHENISNTGPKTLVRIRNGSANVYWEPFRRDRFGSVAIRRNLYKNILGNKLCFEEINDELDIAFRYTWTTSARFGFVRDCELVNLGTAKRQVELVDGLQNILPAGTPRFTQTNSSNLVDAYKWTELDESTGLAFLTLYSGISDRAEPCESLHATTVFACGADGADVLLSSSQLEAFRAGGSPRTEQHRRGIRGAYFLSFDIDLAAGASKRWKIVLDGEKSQSEAAELRQCLLRKDELDGEIRQTIDDSSNHLAAIVAAADAFQSTAEENVAVHHYANVLFNVLRGGIFDDNYHISSQDFRATVRHFNAPTFDRNRELLRELPIRLRVDQLFEAADASGDPQLRRLAREYLPITFGRRHGDPSRPWNQFAILLKDEFGEDLLSYQGNWRDIFQNWEALALSYPAFVENMIAKFVNASTIDGYNPYRITKEGIDWEVEEPDNPWSYIGYWGDHQIIYLLKLLELSAAFNPGLLQRMLSDRMFCYANVPYRIKLLDQLVENPKDTVVFDEALAGKIEQRVAATGADGKLVQNDDDEVLLVNLFEKLLVALLAKLGNLVVDGGIWLNTQRPEWNDANNALVGHGLSMVTLYYLRRYVDFLQKLLADVGATLDASAEVAAWHQDTANALKTLRSQVERGQIDDRARFASLLELGNAASRHREQVYAKGTLSAPVAIEIQSVQQTLADALAVIDRSIESSQREDGMYDAYNIAKFQDDAVGIDTLYPMLEGQVAALSTATLDAEQTIAVLESLYASAVYRADQHSFMLYPDRELPGFLDRNRIPEPAAMAIPLLARMLDEGDEQVVLRDVDGYLRFNSDFSNAEDLRRQLETLNGGYGPVPREAAKSILALYESVFNHKHFTGRSGTMFGFEGLGSIYWHMVSKLLLAVAESYFHALDDRTDSDTLRRLGDLYYDIRSGIGFNKSPAEYGAFPTDPYSHTPLHAGARQPGMTGQVKEEVLTRFLELGLRTVDGQVRIQPALLRSQEFRTHAGKLCYLSVDGKWHTIDVPEASLAFTWCQVSFTYHLDDELPAGIAVMHADGRRIDVDGFDLPADLSRSIFERTGDVSSVHVNLHSTQLFDS